MHLRGVKCVLLGYPPHQKAYKLYDLTNHKVIISRDFFLRKIFFLTNNYLLTNSMQKQQISLSLKMNLLCCRKKNKRIMWSCLMMRKEAMIKKKIMFKMIMMLIMLTLPLFLRIFHSQENPIGASNCLLIYMALSLINPFDNMDQVNNNKMNQQAMHCPFNISLTSLMCIIWLH